MDDLSSLDNHLLLIGPILSITRLKVIAEPGEPTILGHVGLILGLELCVKHEWELMTDGDGAVLAISALLSLN